MQDLLSSGLTRFKYILLNVRHRDWVSSAEIARQLWAKIPQKPEFKLNYQQDGVFLFVNIEKK